jgi:hypothetical protein
MPQELQDALARYVKAARWAASPRPLGANAKGLASRPDTTEVREWAKAQGIEVKDRGRVPEGSGVFRQCPHLC